MFARTVRWAVWTIGGLILLGLSVLHFAGIWQMPDYLLLTIGICTGMYFLMFADAIVGAMVSNKNKEDDHGVS